MADLQGAVATAYAIGDQRLEMVALRALGGDAPIALGRPSADATTHIHRGLRIAMSIGDRAMEADLLARLAIIATNALTFDVAVDYSRRAVLAGRASGDDKALAAALDGRKTSLAYVGEIGELVPVLDELEPLLRRLGDLFRLHWAVFESGLPAVAAGDWATARLRFEEALAINRRSGFPVFASWHVAHLGWLARLQGNYDDARALGRRAIEMDEEMPHAWCGAMLCRTARHHGPGNAARRPRRSRCSSVGAGSPSRTAPSPTGCAASRRSPRPPDQPTFSAEADAMLARVRSRRDRPG